MKISQELPAEVGAQFWCFEMETLEAQCCHHSEASEAPGPRTGQVDFRVMLTFLEFYRAMVKLHPQYFAFVWLKFQVVFLG